jgi:hypothetical protein
MSSSKSNTIPSFDHFMKPLVQALVQLGGSGSIEEINEKVYELTHLKVISSIFHTERVVGARLSIVLRGQEHTNWSANDVLAGYSDAYCKSCKSCVS